MNDATDSVVEFCRTVIHPSFTRFSTSRASETGHSRHGWHAPRWGGVALQAHRGRWGRSEADFPADRMPVSPGVLKSGTLWIRPNRCLQNRP